MNESLQWKDEWEFTVFERRERSEATRETNREGEERSNETDRFRFWFSFLFLLLFLLWKKVKENAERVFTVQE